MTVAQRLYLLIGAAVLGLFTVAGVGMYQLNKTYTVASYAALNTVPSYQVLVEVSKNFANLRALSLTHIITTDDAVMRDLEKRIDEARTGLASSLKKYVTDGCLGASCLSDDREKGLLETVNARFAEYDAVRLKVMALSRQNKTQDALALVRSEMSPASGKLNEALSAELDYNAELATKAADDGVATKGTAMTLSVVISVITLAIVVLMGFLIVRNLQRQLGGEPAYVSDVVKRVAEGDLTVEVAVNNGDTSSMLYAIKGMVAKLSQIIGDVRGSADALSSASEEVSATAQSISQATAEQAASVEETSASVEQMSASIEQNTENAKVTDGMASTAAKQASEGGEAVNQTVDAMKSIADKISIIDDIAYQTNLLALNAAIEAARAGEHGKGFAVVAAEVRKLAERSQVAAQEIGEVAKSSVGLAENAGKLLGEIVPAINKTSDLVQEITSASTEQSSGAGQINTAMNQLNQITQQNASASEELAATAEEMSSQAEQLQQLVGFFKVQGATAVAKTNFKPQTTVDKPTVVRAAAKPVAMAHNVHHDEAEFVKF